jgi:hypothetical protein
MMSCKQCSGSGVIGPVSFGASRIRIHNYYLYRSGFEPVHLLEKNSEKP